MVAVEALSVRNYWFAYPKERLAEGEDATWVLKDVSLSVEQGEFCVMCGPTGCGKSTLLRACKPELASEGQARGTIEVLGRSLVEDGARTETLSAVQSAQMIGFVMQDPDVQIVCDTVWHELAFGLENLGVPQDQMRRRVAEVAHFFGIEAWMGQSTDSLSGGQKQLLNVASALVMNPAVLLLDEPTAQLDPNSRHQFVSMLAHVNRALGVTVIVATHAPGEFSACATRSFNLGEPIPSAAPDTVPENQPYVNDEPPAIEVRDAFFRYDRTLPWVLRGLSARVLRGSVHAFVGGNGCGKSTLLRCMAGVEKPQRGTVRCAVKGTQAFLPQDPKALLVCDSVREELTEWQGRVGYSDEDVEAALRTFGLSEVGHRHPYDLSGGQQQKLAMAKVLLCKPKILYLDEPTKGLDAWSAAEVAHILRGLCAQGVTIVLVTHDLDFAYIAADFVSMVFDGELSCTERCRDFFTNNIIYTPAREAQLFHAYGHLALSTSE